MAEQVETILGHAKYRLTLLAAFAFLLLGLLIAGAQNVHHLNGQGIAYLLLAKHYASGEFALAISGYWSPLISWIIALGLKVGWPDLTAARVATGLAGLLFWVGSVALLFITRAPTRAILLGAWLVAIATVHWSVEYISPDLLAAAFLLNAMAATLYTFRIRSKAINVLAGLLWGSVYYAHAMLLPAVVISLLAFGIIGKIAAKPNTKPFLPSLATQALIAVLSMLPWWALLSSTYKQATIGSAWAIEHAVAGPQDVDRYHPCFGQFNPPAEGRLANWEDPSRLEYTSWSASANEEYAIHQNTLIKRNLKSMFGIFREFGSFGLGIILLIGCLFIRLPFQAVAFSETWRWTLFPALGLVIAFLPFTVTPLDTRFFYAAFPLAVIAGFGLLNWLPQSFAWARFPSTFANILLAIFLALPVVPRLAASLEGITNPGGYATLDMVERMKAANISGTIAGDGLLVGSRTGLFIAALLNEPWIGDSPDVVGTDYLSSGADIIIVHRQHRVNSDMEFNPVFRDLDTVLFSDKLQAKDYPLRAYQINR